MKLNRGGSNNVDVEDHGKTDRREDRRKKAAGGKVGGGTQVNYELYIV